jgi:anthranilate phosphoribosyltransferase
MRAAELLPGLAEGRRLDESSARAMITAILEGSWDDAETAAALTAMRVRGETAEEIAGAAKALRAHLAPLPIEGASLLDTCGTGGDGLRTFNISTAAAIIAAAAGAKVAKHGNRAVSSTSGSADVLEKLGVRIDAEPERVLAGLESAGLAFFFAPRWHPVMKRVAGVRGKLKFRTIFNLIGPLANPAGARRQLVGAGSLDLAERLAEVLGCLDVERAFVVHGGDGLDEVTLAGPTEVRIVERGQVRAARWTPTDFGLPSVPTESLAVDTAEESAMVIRGVLAGEAGPARLITLANAAAALLAAGLAEDLRHGMEKARAAVDSGAAQATLERWRESTA